MPRYNKSRNPSCDGNTVDWGSGNTITRTANQTVATTGKTFCGAINASASAFGSYLAGGGAYTATSGQTWTVVGYVFSTVARTIRPGISVWNGTTYVSTGNAQADVALAANTWTRLRFAFTTPTGTYSNIRLHCDFPTAGTAGIFRMAAIRFEQGSYATTLEFADGSTGGQWSWDGTAGNSTSTMSDAVPITVRTASSGGTVTRPTLNLHYSISTLAATTSSTAARPTLAQRSTLTARAAATTPTVSRPTLAQRHTLQVRSAQTTSTVVRPVLGLALLSARTDSTATRPTLAQRTTLQIRAARTSSTVTRPTVAQRTALLIRAPLTTGTATRRTLAQRSTLLIRRAVTAGTATRPIVRFRAGRPVQVPTTVAVQTRYGTTTVRHRQGHVTAPNRAATTQVDVRGQIVVEQRYGTVLETAP